jgi:hypothetical protein
MIKDLKRKGRPPLKKGEARNLFHGVMLNREDIKKLALVRKAIGENSVSNTFRRLLLNEFDSIVELEKSKANV